MAVDIKKTGIQSPTGSWHPNSAPKVRPIGKQADPYGAWGGASKTPPAKPTKVK